MAIPNSPLYYMTGGFLLGMFFMYNVFSLRTNAYIGHLHRRADPTNKVLMFGNPGPVVDLFERQAYTAAYNRKERIPHWVGEHLTAESIKTGDGVNRGKSKFLDDPALPALFRVYTNDYTNSGYDRGHMAPAADAGTTQDSLDETFLLTNVAPQVGVGFNRQYWAYLESFCRDLTSNFTDVFVYTGPLFLPQLVSNSKEYAFDGSKVSFGDNGFQKGAATTVGEKYIMQYSFIGSKSPAVAVPTHFYKIILTQKEGKYALAAFVLPNQAIPNTTPLDKFQVDLQAIEKASGLLYLQTLDRKSLLKLCDLIKCSISK
ncbi:unnamed protein product [Mucor hiemalis]